MDQLHAARDKLAQETAHLDRILEDEPSSQEQVDLALSVAKRVRREAQTVVRGLAQLRDELAAMGGTSPARDQ